MIGNLGAHLQKVLLRHEERNTVLSATGVLVNPSALVGVPYLNIWLYVHPPAYDITDSRVFTVIILPKI